jgi:sec-independent protein translocase protein TatA
MGSMSLMHWLVVLAIILVLFGAGKLPRVMGDFAKGIKAFKAGMKEEDETAEATPPAQVSPPAGTPTTSAGSTTAPGATTAQGAATAAAPASATPAGVTERPREPARS